mmetsp:Transcript_4944/g.8570  ORF Transcript_4944/g.8570 Transcript_4944/m.8570 type:complete len:82 (+) Transcript_4944:89-334(+)
MRVNSPLVKDSLAVVRKHYWKKSDNVELQYRSLASSLKHRFQFALVKANSPLVKAPVFAQKDLFRAHARSPKHVWQSPTLA